MPRLFASGATWVAEGTSVDEGVQTPLGTVKFTATADGQAVVAVEPDRWRVSDDAWLERWESSDMQLERLTCKLRPDLPPRLHVDGCWGVVWRFLAHRKIAQFGAAARLAAPFPDGHGDSGWHLATVAFETETCEMHIGTQDEDALAERAGLGTLPDRWRDPNAGWTPPWYDSLRLFNRLGVFPAILWNIKHVFRGPDYPYDTFTIEGDADGLAVCCRH